MTSLRLRRGGWPLAVVVVLLAGSLLSVGADDRAGSDWPVFRGNAAQTGVAPAALPESLAVRWQFKARNRIEGTPAVVAGTVFIGSLDLHLYALGLADGREKWRYKAGPFKAPPAVRDGAVYVGDGNGTFHCLDAATGRARWTFDAGAEVTSAASFAADAVLFGSADETLHCLSFDGRARWKFRIPGGPVLGSPVVLGGQTLVAGCDKTLHVLDTARGTAQSSFPLPGQTAGAAAVAGDRLYVGTMSNQVLAVDWKTGAAAWRFEADRSPQPFYSSVALTDALVVVGSRDKRVYGLDRATGRPVWTFLTAGRVDSSPVVAGRRVYVASLDGHLYVLDLDRGTEVQKHRLDRPVFGSPAVADGCLVVGTLGGNVYCFAAK